MSERALSFACRDTELGELLLAGDEEALIYLGLRGREDLPKLREYVAREYPACELVERARPLALALRQVEEYARGERLEFDLELEPVGSDFELSVWTELCLIPYGETRSYGSIASRIRQPGAARAVGQANGRNPIPIVIPCHRCVAAKGLGGFSGGLDRKQQLLALERKHSQSGQGIFLFEE